MDAKDRIIRAKVQLQGKKPFFAYILLHMFEKEDPNCPTMGVNKFGRMVYNPEFIMTLSDDELESVLAHESLHVVLRHLFRIDKRHPTVWNFAADAQCNDILVGENMSLPENTIIPKNHKFDFGCHKLVDIDKKHTEEIYDELYPKIPKIKVDVTGIGGDGKGDGGNGDGDLPPRFDVHEFGDEGNGNKDEHHDKEKNPGGLKPESLDKHWDGVLSEAATHAKSKGSLPAGVSRLVEDLLEPKVNWRHILHRAVTNALPFDFSWKFPSKKSFATGIYMPNVVRENVDVVVSVDTSGSIGQQELTEFLSEIVSMSRSFQNLAMTVIVCDCKIHKVYEVKNGSIPKIMAMEMLGGGGTSHIPVYEWLAENKPDAKLIINFTDGMTSFPEKEPYVTKTLWVITGEYCETDMPFGDVIKLE